MRPEFYKTKNTPLGKFNNLWVPEPNSGCWLWTGTGTVGGYGTFYFKKAKRLAHRVSWILHNGEIPDGLYVCHKCDVRCCVNPNHLFLGTHKENAEDMVRKGRARGARGEAHFRSKLTRQQVIAIRLSTKSAHELASEFGVSPTNIWGIRGGNTWRHLKITVPAGSGELQEK
jgi:hypothetical protein